MFTDLTKGYVCQGKSLSQTHPFFAKLEESGPKPDFVHVRREEQTGVQEDDDPAVDDCLFDDVDGEYDDTYDSPEYDSDSDSS